jgi:hypothetical protein
MSVIYLIGALKNPEVPKAGEYLRSLGFEVFDDWYSAGPEADDCLRDHYRSRGFNYREIMESHSAKHIFEFDYKHLNRADIGVMLMPAGKSAHLELGYLIGRGRPGYILFDKEPERVDIMHQFATGIFFNVEEMGQEILRTSKAHSIVEQGPFDASWSYTGESPYKAGCWSWV